MPPIVQYLHYLINVWKSLSTHIVDFCHRWSCFVFERLSFWVQRCTLHQGSAEHTWRNAVLKDRSSFPDPFLINPQVWKNSWGTLKRIELKGDGYFLNNKVKLVSYHTDNFDLSRISTRAQSKPNQEPKPAQ